MKHTFLYSVCGNSHAARLNLSLKFLKHFSKQDILVVASRIDTKIEHDQVVGYDPPPDLSQCQASIVQKTLLPKIVGRGANRFCYIDTDVMAVSTEVNSIFGYDPHPLIFSKDHVSLDTFSRHAVACGCAAGECDHLRSALESKFQVTVSDKGWRHWNGGVFLFTAEATDFFRLWHTYCISIMKDPYWKTRDQSALIAAAWKLGLQNLPTLPRKFNTIVDGLHGRRRAATAALHVDDSFCLTGQTSKPKPAFLHFINGTAGRRGWKNWDDAELLLNSRTRTLHAISNGLVKTVTPVRRRKHALSADNRVVHGMWIGTRLSKLELLTLHSFVQHGHEFHLWLYDDLQNQLPEGVVVEDGDRILPRHTIFRKKDTDGECGVGKGSLGSPFSDLFRYKLLYEYGGYWVDMDVTCLRPFDFKTPYVFRTHRIGVVGNIVKCPKHSRLMLQTYEQVAHIADENTEWLAPNRILNENIGRLGLRRYIRSGICNEDSWWDSIKPLIEEDRPLPAGWYAIHWINEFWRTLRQEGGIYRGQQMLRYEPDKDRPSEGSALHRLYRAYGLVKEPNLAAGSPEEQETRVDDWSGRSHSVISLLESKTACRQPIVLDIPPHLHVNVLVPSMTLGGAERSIYDTLARLAQLPITCKLFLLHKVNPAFPADKLKNVRVYYVDGLDLSAQARAIALEVVASPSPVIYTHMIEAKLLRELWTWNVFTIPVIQNSQPGWQDPPSAFDRTQVPFVVAVAEAVERELQQGGCPKPIVVMRHEIPPFLSEDEKRMYRQDIRGRYSISADTILIGMVGQFKSQKAYTRAVRVLKGVREKRNAKLMILGGWDHHWGNGRAAYAAACRLALDLSVMPDLITPGAVQDARPYYSAFDVFLNTSIYEGFSIAILEALQAGCPVVAADVGGNREAQGPNCELVGDPSHVEAYVQAIFDVLHRTRISLPPHGTDTDLVPRLWCLLAQYARAWHSSVEGTSTLFLTETLSPAEQHRDLANLLRNWPDPKDALVCTLGPVQCERQLAAIESSGARVFSLRGQSAISQAEQVCYMARRLGVRSICMWHVSTQLKLLLAKVLPADLPRLVDVASEATFGSDLQGTEDFQKRICLTADHYLRRLHAAVVTAPFVGPSTTATLGRKLTRIGHGVLPLPAGPIQGEDITNSLADLAVGTCCPIEREMGLEFLLDIAAEMNRQRPDIRITVSCETGTNDLAYARELLRQVAVSGLENIEFVRHDGGPETFLRRLGVYVVLSDRQLLSLGTLEAMAAGVPVVAHASRIAGMEWLHQAVNFTKTPAAAAKLLLALLQNNKPRVQLGAHGREIVLRQCSMKRMVNQYLKVLH